jgi:hypothetical protein
VCRGQERGLTLSPRRNSFDEQDDTAEMDLVSEDSYHAAEDDLPTARMSQRTRSRVREQANTGLSRHPEKQRSSIRPHSASQRLSQQPVEQQQALPTIPQILSRVEVIVPRLPPPVTTTTRRTSPRAGKKHQRQFSDTTVTPFDLRKSAIRAANTYTEDNRTPRPGFTSLGVTLSGPKRPKRLCYCYRIRKSDLLTRLTVIQRPVPRNLKAPSTTIKQPRGRLGRPKTLTVPPVRTVHEGWEEDEQDDEEEIHQPQPRPPPRTQKQPQRRRQAQLQRDEDNDGEEVEREQQGLNNGLESLSERFFRRPRVSAVRAIELGEHVMQRGNEEVSVYVSHVFGSPQSDPERRPLHTDILFQPVDSVGTAASLSTVAPRRLVVSSWQQISTAVVNLSKNVCFVEFLPRESASPPQAEAPNEVGRGGYR